MTRRGIVRGALAALFATSGTLHFVTPRSFVQIVPRPLPNPEALVTISGAAELAGAIGLLLPRTRRAASYGLVALLIAVFPANLTMALESERFRRVAPAWALWLRLPLQPVLIWLVALAGQGAGRRFDAGRRHLRRSTAPHPSE